MRYVFQTAVTRQLHDQLYGLPGVSLIGGWKGPAASISFGPDGNGQAPVRVYCALNSSRLVQRLVTESGSTTVLLEGNAAAVGNQAKTKIPRGRLTDTALNLIDSTPFQAEGISKLLTNGVGIFCAGTGTGKTLVSIAVTLGYDGIRLIITRAANKQGYADAIRGNARRNVLPFVAPEFSSCYLLEGEKKLTEEEVEEIEKKYAFIIAAHETVQAHIAALTWMKPSTIVIDELHMAQSAKRFRAVPGKDGEIKFHRRNNRANAMQDLSVNHAAAGKPIFGFTATPVTDRPRSLYAQLDLIEPRGWGDKHSFEAHYCDGHSKEDGYGKWTATGGSNLDELRERWHTIAYQVPLEVAKAQMPRLRYKSVFLLRATASDEGRDALRSEDSQIAIATACAMPYCVSRVLDAVEEGIKSTVFVVRREDAEKLHALILRKLGKSSIPVVLIHGGKVTAKKRYGAIEPFIAAPGAAVLVATGASMGESMDGLQCSSLAILGALPFTPRDLEQWVGRFERFGGVAGGCCIELVIPESTYAERIASILIEKAPFVQAIVPGAAVGIATETLLTGSEEKALAVILADRSEHVEPLKTQQATENF